MRVRAGWLVGVAAILVYLPSLGGDFVYDDRVLVVENEHVHSLADPGRFFSDPDTLSSLGALHSYRPLRTLLFAVEWSIFGGSPLGWRVVSVLLHAAVALLLLVLLRTWTARPRGSLVAALVFAVHPVATECVPWVSIQGDLLMTGAMLGALLALDVPQPGRIALGCALFLVAAGFKEQAVVFPVLLLVRIIGLHREEGSGRRWVAALVATAVLAGLYVMLRQSAVTAVAGETTAHRPWYGGNRWTSIGAFLGGAIYYAGTLAFPVDLTIRWAPYAPPTGAGEWILTVGGGLLLLGAAAFAVVRLIRRRPGPVPSGLLLALVVLGPASSVLVPLPTISELRYLYPVLPFLLLAIVPLLDRIGTRPAFVLVISLAALAVPRALEWRGDEALWRAALDRPRSTPEALFNVAVIDLARGRREIEEHRDPTAALLNARRLLMEYSRHRLGEIEYVLPFERRLLVDSLTDVARALRAIDRAPSAIEPAAMAVDISGVDRECLLFLAETLRAAGREADARRVEDDARRLR